MDVYEKIMQEEWLKGQGQTTTGQGTPPIVCPEMANEKCHVCEQCYEVFKKKPSKDSPIRERASKYNQKKKYYSNITFPAINPENVICFEYGEKIFRKLINAQMDVQSEYKNFFDPINGRNMYIIKYPAPQKRNTDYGVEFRIQSTSLVNFDPKKLFVLNTIPTLVANGLTIFRQGELNDGRNEVRIMPSWLGPQSKMFFFLMKYHFMPKDEFEAVQAGKLHLFKDEIVIPNPSVQPFGVFNQTPTEGWGTYTKDSNGPKQMCFGTYDAGSPLCLSKCEKSTVPACIAETELRKNREIAKGLGKPF